MGQPTANVSRRIFKEYLRYVMNVVQQGIPWVDADENDFMESIYTQMRRVTQILGDGEINNGFMIVGVNEDNDFMVKGGEGNLEDSGRMFVSGHGGRMIGDVMWKAGAPTNTSLPGVQEWNPSTVADYHDEDQFSIYNYVTSLSYDSGSGQTVISDNGANWQANELTGREIILKPTDVSETTHVIVSNTNNKIRVTGDITTAATGRDRYRLGLTTPSGSDREDSVYLNLWLDEVNAEVDNELYHVTSTVVVEAQRRWRLEQNIHIREDNPTHGNLNDYIDVDGNEHFVFKLATIERENGNPQIRHDMITDHRPALRKLTSINNLADKVGEDPDTEYDDVTGPPNYTSTPYVLADGYHHNKAISELDLEAERNKDFSGKDNLSQDAPIYSTKTSNEYAITDLDPLANAIALLDVETERKSTFLGKTPLTQTLPDYSANTTGFSIGINDPVQDAIGKLDDSLENKDHDDLKNINEAGSAYQHVAENILQALIPHGGFTPGPANPIPTVDWVLDQVANLSPKFAFGAWTDLQDFSTPGYYFLVDLATMTNIVAPSPPWPASHAVAHGKWIWGNAFFTTHAAWMVAPSKWRTDHGESTTTCYVEYYALTHPYLQQVFSIFWSQGAVFLHAYFHATGT